MAITTSSPFILPLALSLIISSSISLSFATFNLTSDQSTLVALKNHVLTTNPNHFLAGNWTPAASVCDWAGVSCGSRHRRVTALNLSGMELTATVPSPLGNLSFLVSLDLSNNGFYGDLPEDLAAGMPRLRVINLFNNSFSGFFPTSFTNISKLEILIIAENNLHGNIPQEIGNLTNLKQFYGGVNKFSGSIPSGIGRLRMLEYLYLGDNLLQGSIPQEISNLDNLYQIGLRKNNLSGSIPIGFFNISSLQTISITQNNLSGSLPSSMGQTLPDLEYLFLYQNHISGKIPDSISNSSKLKQISLQHNKFTGPIPNSLGNLKFLDCLHLYGNQLTNDQDQDQELSFLTSLTNCRFLRDLVVSENPLSGFLPPSIGNFSSSLIRVYANRCMIKGKIPDEIGNLTYLNNLDLSDNDLSGSLPTTVTGLQRLQGLFLGDNKIEGSLSDSLCGMPQLSTLNLMQNQILGQIPDCLGNVTSLRNLLLASNGLDSSIPSSLWNLEDLLELDLSSNSLSGNLPLEIQNLKVATSINLSINGFTGVIPDVAYGSMQNLINFSLASNDLHGNIPRSFSSMISLVSLDLSNNNLSGEIPMELEGLKFLTYFNVSFNRLSGEIPRKGPFKNFGYLMFESNEALCSDDDPELLRVPHCPDSSSSSSSSTHKQILLITVLSVVMGSLVVLAVIFIAFLRKKTRKETLKEGNSSSIDSKEMERFSYQQLKQATEDFSNKNLLGRGSFGSVYRATFESGTVLAVKVFDLEQEHASRSFERECEMLSRLRHRNLTKVISACSNVLDFKALILEYMQNGSLEGWLHGSDDDHHGCLLGFLQRLDVMIDVASALEYLHHGYVKPVIHCDLKPSNVLLDGDMVGRVSDFGITKLVGEEGSVVYTQTLATLGYMAPEFGIEGLVSSACDVYSFGILLMETFTGKRPCDDMFAGDLSLRSWINSMLPDSVSLVVDSGLTREEEEDDDKDDEHFTRTMQCVSSIFTLAMACTVESPRDRLKMKNVLTALEKIKLHFVATCGSSTQG